MSGSFESSPVFSEASRHGEFLRTHATRTLRKQRVKNGKRAVSGSKTFPKSYLAQSIVGISRNPSEMQGSAFLFARTMFLEQIAQPGRIQTRVFPTFGRESSQIVSRTLNSRGFFPPRCS